MNQSYFTTQLRRELLCRGLPLTRSEVHKYVTAVWPAALMDPMVARWADRLMRSGLAAALVSTTLPRRAKERH
jgi:hypothetical protein